MKIQEKKAAILLKKKKLIPPLLCLVFPLDLKKLMIKYFNLKFYFILI
jgi:hypothetical protein